MISLLPMLVSLGGSLAGAIGSIKGNREMKKNLEQQGNEDNLWYMKKYYENPTEASHNKAILTEMKENLKEQQKQQQAQAKISGATPEAQLAAADNSNKAYSQTARAMSAEASKKRDLVGEQWRAAKRENQNKLNQLQAEQNAQWGNVVNNAMQLGMSAASMIGSNVTPNKMNNLTNKINADATLKNYISNPTQEGYNGLSWQQKNMLNRYNRYGNQLGKEGFKPVQTTWYNLVTQ